MEPERSRRTSCVPRVGEPFAIRRSDGVCLISLRGRRILHAPGGAAVANIVHGSREVAVQGFPQLSGARPADRLVAGGLRDDRVDPR
jgi:4-aminobutyrate aminotransferase-like enzyme